MASANTWRGAAAAFLALIIAACGKPPQQSGPPPTEVSVVKVDRRPVPIELTYMARTAGVREVEVRARVSGILLRRLYTEGSRVKEGDLLFRIDPAPYAAEVERARAQVAVEQARSDEAAQQKRRADPLVEQGVVSKREYDEAVAAAASTQAALEAAKADLRKARLDLSYTDVRAPITGLTSREARSEGSLVNADDDTSLLTRISQSDQLYVQFSLPVGEAEMVRAALQQPQTPVKVIVQSAEGKDLQNAAKLEFVDTLVDQASGTVQARATLANQDSGLLPGQFVRARIVGIMLPNATVVPARAVLHSPMGAMVWVVNDQNQVEPRPVTVGQTIDNDVLINSGLNGGERIIAEGVIKVRPGAPVKPSPYVPRAQASQPTRSQTSVAPPTGGTATQH
jgi:membrane fusion protein (multidrug efflux system)